MKLKIPNQVPKTVQTSGDKEIIQKTQQSNVHYRESCVKWYFLFLMFGRDALMDCLVSSSLCSTR